MTAALTLFLDAFNMHDTGCTDNQIEERLKQIPRLTEAFGIVVLHETGRTQEVSSHHTVRATILAQPCTVRNR